MTIHHCGAAPSCPTRRHRAVRGAATAATAVLTAVLMVGCTAQPADPADAASSAGGSVAPEAVAGTASSGTKDTGTRPDATPVPPLPGAPATAVDPALGPGTAMTATGATDQQIADMRADPSYEAAVATAQYLLAAWRDAIAGGDATRLRDLASPDCAFCHSIAESSQDAPLTPQDGFEVAMTMWPLGDSPARDDFPYPTATVGMALLVFSMGEVDGVPHAELVAQEHQKLSIAVVRTDDRWSVHGVSSSPWDGTSASATP